MCILEAEAELSGHSPDVLTARKLLQVGVENEWDQGQSSAAVVARAVRRITIYKTYDILRWIMTVSPTIPDQGSRLLTKKRPSLSDLVSPESCYPTARP